MDWYHDEVQAALKKRAQCPYPPKTIFYGSSSITLWKTLHQDFAPYAPLNLGFGGSTLAACTWFFNTLVAPLPMPARLILYAGDNDLGDGRRPEEVYLFYHEFKILLRATFGNIPFYFISIKPSPARSQLAKKIEYANTLIHNDIKRKEGNDYYVDVYSHMVDSHHRILKKYFLADGLHLNENGYVLWTTEILRCLPAV